MITAEVFCCLVKCSMLQGLVLLFAECLVQLLKLAPY